MRLWPLVLLVGCGDDGVHHLRDAPSSGSLTVTVREGQAPLAGATVYVQGPDSTLIATLLTDGSGMVIANGVVPGTSVTVLAGAVLRTLLDVQPDDELVFVGPSRGAGTQVPIKVRASVQPTLDRYIVATPCGIDEISKTMTMGTLLVQDCATADVLIDVRDPTRKSLESAFAPAQPMSGALDLSALVYTPTTLLPFSISNVPETWHDVHLYRTLSLASGPLLECDSFGDDVRCPVVPGVTVIDRVTAYDDTVWHASYFPTTSSTTTIDFVSLPIATIPDAPTIDLAASTVHWTGGAGANMVQVSLSESDADWTIYGATPADGRLALPRLPAELTPFTANVAVHTMLMNVVGGYASVRPRVFATDTSGLVTATGSRVITAAYEGGF